LPEVRVEPLQGEGSQRRFADSLFAPDEGGKVRRVGVTDTTLRDAHQSLMATRLKTRDMVPILERIDEVGYHSLEVWGGATFDACIRFLDEDPWERLRVVRGAVKRTKLQMLLRGQNVVGYRHYPDDVVREFVKRAIGNGVDIIRVFDALNDTRNMEVAADQVKREGGHLQLAISYTTSPVHTLESFLDLAVEFKSMGADSICIKDMAGIISPPEAYHLVKGIKERTGLPVQLHSHYTSGMASMAYLAAVLAGVDVVDCAISPLSMGTSQPPVESFVAALKGTRFDTGLDLKLLAEIAEYFKEVRDRYKEHYLGLSGVDVNVLVYQIPGGMYSNLVSQLKEQKALHRLGEVLREVPRVREEMGYPPLVTPTSQLVGTQATINVVVGERWKVVPKEIRDYFMGYYGRTPAPVDPEVQRKVLGDARPIEGRPADHLEPALERARREIEPWMTQEEDVLTYVLFPAVALDFIKRKYARMVSRDVGLGQPVEGVAYPV